MNMQTILYLSLWGRFFYPKPPSRPALKKHITFICVFQCKMVVGRSWGRRDYVYIYVWYMNCA